MKCRKCQGEWKTDQRISSSLLFCPFCGEDLSNYGSEPEIFDNLEREFTVTRDRQLAASVPTSAPVPQLSQQQPMSVPVRHQAKPQPSQQSSAPSKIKQWEKPQTPLPQPTYSSEMVVVAEILQGKTRNLMFGGYEWRVLGIRSDQDKQNRALLLTEDIIEKRPYNTQISDITWENCTLRQYLNGEFYGKFSRQEQAMISEVNNINADNQWYDTYGGNATTDKVFLLSIEDTVEYFGDSGQLQNHLGFLISDQFNSERMGKYDNQRWWWWLRSPGLYSSIAAYEHCDGRIDLLGGYVNIDWGGVRPALWLNLIS